jgi:hypothetical protein
VIVTKRPAQVYLQDLAQAYDGMAKSVTATTMPAGLTVEFTYDGNGWAPTNWGTYAVTGTINDLDYSGSASGILVVDRYCSASPTNSPGPCIGRVQFNEIDHGSECSPHSDFTSVTTSVSRAGAYALTVSNSGAISPPPACYAWVDWNQDGDLVDPGEFFELAGGPEIFTGTITVPADAAYGATRLRLRLSVPDAVPGDPCGEFDAGEVEDYTVFVTKGVAQVFLQDLAQTYDGTARTATATTMPAGLTVEFTYDGMPAAPTDAGSYAVTGRVHDADFDGSASGTLVIGKAMATVMLDDLVQTYDGTPKSATATPDPAGLTVDLTYDGSPAAPTSAGSYAVTGTVNDVNYQGSSAGTLTIGKAAATVTLDDLSRTYDGTARTVTATTDPAGLTVELTYDGNAWAPTNIGSYAVTGTVNHANYMGSTTGTLEVAIGTAQVFLQGLAQEYDGNARTVTATTMPAGLTVEFTYDGNPWAPTNIGSYAVTGTVNDANYQGSAGGILVVDYCNASSAGCEDEYISRVQFNTIDNASDCSPYSDFTAITTEVRLAAAYAITVTNGRPFFSDDVCGVWVDWNQDGDLVDPGEYTELDGDSDVFTGTILVPADAALGPTRMRLRLWWSHAASAAPCGIGEYAWGEVEDYTVIVTEGAAEVFLQELAQTYDGTARTITATTMPAGLTVEFTYDGNDWAPTNAGSYAVTGTVNDLRWQGSATGTLAVGKAAATVELGSLSQTYDGTPKAATATTDPAGLAVELHV